MLFGRRPYGDLLPLDLCVRLASEKSQRQYEPVILQQTLPHQIESGTKLEKVLPMRNSPLTPSPSSSSSHDNEEEMGYVQAPPQHFSIYRSRQIHQQSPLQVCKHMQFREITFPIFAWNSFLVLYLYLKYARKLKYPLV